MTERAGHVLTSMLMAERWIVDVLPQRRRRARAAALREDERRSAAMRNLGLPREPRVYGAEQLRRDLLDHLGIDEDGRAQPWWPA